MHRSTILLVPVLCAPLMLVGCGRDASKPAATTPAASTSASGESAATNGTLVKVAQIDGIDANDEFTHNVGVLQAGREEVMRMDESLKKLPAGKDHDDLQARMDAKGCTTFTEFKAALVEEARTMSQEYCKRLFAGMQRRVQSCITKRGDLTKH